MLLQAWPATGMFVLIFGYVAFVLIQSFRRVAARRGTQASWKGRQGADHASKSLPTPECIFATLPIIGHVVKYVKHGHRYFSTLCASTTLPIFTIRMANFRVSIIKPALTRALPKVRHLTLGALVVEIFQRSLDLHPSSCALLKEEDERSKTFAPALSRLFREEFVPIENVRRHLGRLDGFMTEEIARLTGREKVFLEETMFNIFVGALGKLLWAGNAGPFGQSSFLTHLRTLLLNIQRLANPATFMISSSLLESRSIVRNFLARFGIDNYTTATERVSQEQPSTATKFSAGQQETSTSAPFLDRVRELCDRHGAASDGWTDHQLLLIFGLVPNVAAASTWMMHHLLADPTLLRVLRTEIDAAVAAAAQLAHSSESSSPSENAINLSLQQLEQSCPHILATWYEVLRFRGGFTVGRYVHADTPLAGKYLLQRGTFLLAPLRPHHFDKRAWGDDADIFRPCRWLVRREQSKTSGEGDEEMRTREHRDQSDELSELQIDAALVKKLKVYGVFGSLCPGRFLAMHFAVLGIIRLLLAFDVTTLGGSGEHILPEECKDTLVGVVTPASDVSVSLQPRCHRQVVKISFKDTGQNI